MSDATPSWWQTIPGIVTAIAGAVTAVGGLLLTLNQIGLIGSGSDAPAQSAAPAQTVAAGEAGPAQPPAAGPGESAGPPRYSVEFTSGTEVTLRSSRADGLYQILGAEIDNRNTGTLSLKLSVRLTSNGPLDLGFWGDTFRLRVDGVPRAPTNFLNDLVPARSAKEGEVIFDVPEAARNLELLIDNNEDSARMPLVLRKSG